MTKFHFPKSPSFPLGILSILLLLSFLMLNAAISVLWGQYQADFSSSKRYTLSVGSKEILSSLSHPVFIKLYMSPQINDETPDLAQYAQSLLRFLERYQRLNPQQIRLQILNPLPYSPLAEAAQEEGLRTVTFRNNGTPLLFGAVFYNEEGQKVVIPFFEPLRKNELENDITRLIWRLQEKKLPQIGITAPNLPVMYKGFGLDLSPEWQLIRNLRTDFNVKYISENASEIPANVDALILINPQKLSATYLFALDQYILRGGRLLLLLDPDSETETSLQGKPMLRDSNIRYFLQQIGISYQPQQVIGDSQSALTVNEDGKQISYPLWMNIQSSNIRRHPITNGLTNLTLRTPGSLELIPESKIQQQILFTTSRNSFSATAHLVKYSSKTGISDLLQPLEKPQILGILIEGTFRSRYAHSLFEQSPTAQQLLPFLSQSVAPAKIIIFTDSDMAADHNWAVSEYGLNSDIYSTVPLDDNAALLRRSLDYLLDRTSLLGVNSSRKTSENTNFASLLNSEIETRYAARIAEAQISLKNEQKSLDLLKEKIGERRLVPSLKVMKDLERHSEKINALQKQLQAYDYFQRQEYQNMKNRIIIVNTLFIPAVLIIFLWLLSHIREKRTNRRALQYLEKKDD